MAKKKSLVEPNYLVLLRAKLRKITDGETRAKIAPSKYKKDALQFAADNKSDPNY